MNDQELSFICAINLWLRNRYQLGVWLYIMSLFGNDAVSGSDVSG